MISGRMSGNPFEAIGDAVLFGRLAEPRSAETRRIAVVGDPHLATRAEGTNRVFHRSEARLEACIADCNGRDLDLVVFPGDLTKDGEPWNYDRVEALLASLEHPFVAVPGNHDLRTDGHDHDYPTARVFGDRVGGPRLDGNYPAAITLGDLEICLLNTAGDRSGAYASTHRGRLCPDQRAWLEEHLERVAETERTPIVVCHHNPIPLVGSFLRDTRPWNTFTLRERARVQPLLERQAVPLIVSGHHHLPALSREHGIAQLIAPALASYPQAYCLLELGPDGTAIWLVSVADASERAEAHDLAVSGGPFYRTLLGLTETTLGDLPLVTESSPLETTLVSE